MRPKYPYVVEVKKDGALVTGAAVPVINFGAGLSAVPRPDELGVDVSASGGGAIGPTPGSLDLVPNLARQKPGVASSFHNKAPANATVFVFGGATDIQACVPSAVVESYDPRTLLFSLAGTLNSPRINPTVVTLNDGRILVLAGFTAPPPLNTVAYNVELYDPATGLTRSAFRTKTVQKHVTAGAVDGGFTAGDQVGSLWVFPGTGLVAMNVITGTTYPPTAASIGGQSVMLQVAGAPAPGQFQVSPVAAPGGTTIVFNAGFTGFVEITFIYQAESVTRDAPGPMLAPVAEAGAVLCDDGRVLVVGGDPGDGVTQATSFCQVFDPTTGGWVNTGALNAARTTSNQSVIKLPDGSVLVAGGTSVAKDAGGFSFLDVLQSAELWVPGTVGSETWSMADPMPTRRTEQAMCLLEDGSVMMAGGYGEQADLSPTVRCDVYIPSQDRWAIAGNMQVARANAIAVAADAGAMVYGGYAAPSTETALQHTAEVFDLRSGFFSPIAGSSTGNLPNLTPSWGTQVGVLPGGQFLVPCGTNADNQAPVAGAALVDLS